MNKLIQKRQLRRHGPLICIAAFLLLILIVSVCLLFARTGDTLQYETRMGDAAFLNGFPLKMTIADYTHSQRFTIEKGRLVREGYRYNMPQNAPLTPYTYADTFVCEAEDAALLKSETWYASGEEGAGGNARIEYLERTMDRGRLYISLYFSGVNTRGAGYQANSWLLRTGLIMPGPIKFVWRRNVTQGSDPKGEPYFFEEKQLGQEHCLSLIGGDGAVYATPFIIPGTTGESGIYRISDPYTLAPETTLAAWPDGTTRWPSPTERAGALEPLCTFPAQGVRPIRLYEKADTLLLLYGKGGGLWMRGWDLNGTPLGEFRLADLPADFLENDVIAPTMKACGISPRIFGGLQGGGGSHSGAYDDRRQRSRSANRPVKNAMFRCRSNNQSGTLWSDTLWSNEDVDGAVSLCLPLSLSCNLAAPIGSDQSAAYDLGYAAFTRTGEGLALASVIRPETGADTLTGVAYREGKWLLLSEPPTFDGFPVSSHAFLLTGYDQTGGLCYSGAILTDAAEDAYVFVLETLQSGSFPVGPGAYFGANRRLTWTALN